MCGRGTVAWTAAPTLDERTVAPQREGFALGRHGSGLDGSTRVPPAPIRCDVVWHIRRLIAWASRANRWRGSGATPTSPDRVRRWPWRRCVASRPSTGSWCATPRSRTRSRRRRCWSTRMSASSPATAAASADRTGSAGTSTTRCPATTPAACCTGRASHPRSRPILSTRCSPTAAATTSTTHIPSCRRPSAVTPVRSFSTTAPVKRF